MQQNLPGERLLIKLLEIVVSEGIGTLARPTVIKRDARAKALADADTKRIAKLAAFQLREELKELKSGKKVIGKDYELTDGPNADGKLLAGLNDETEYTPEDLDAIKAIKTKYLQSLGNANVSPQALIELERRMNLDQIAFTALEEAANDRDHNIDEEPIDPDWFVQWRNRARDVSNEEMQLLWARVLNGQAKEGGSFSIHAMDFLSRMSRKDAELIELLGRFVIGNSVVYSKAIDGGIPLLQKHGLTFARLLYLAEIGILSRVDGLNTLGGSFSFVHGGNSERALARCHDKVLVFYRKSAEQNQITVVGYPVSTIGREILSLAQCSAVLGYLKSVADGLRDSCSRIEIADFVELAEGFDIRNPVAI